MVRSSNRYSGAKSWTIIPRRGLCSHCGSFRTPGFAGLPNLAAHALTTRIPDLRRGGNALQLGATPDQGHPGEHPAVRSLRRRASMPSDLPNVILSSRLAERDWNPRVRAGVKIEWTASRGTCNDSPKYLGGRSPRPSGAVSCYPPAALGPPPRAITGSA